MFIFSDIFIGDYRMSQGWGQRPEVYARFRQAGHSGWDYIMPNGTQIVSPADGLVLGVYEQRNAKGKFINFGRYCKVLHEQGGKYCVSVYAHLQSVEVNKGQKVVKGRLIALSDDNGFSSTPHLHFGIHLSDAQGAKIETNKFGGYHNPVDNKIFKWEPVNLQEPVQVKADDLVGKLEDKIGLLERTIADMKRDWAGDKRGLDNASKDYEELQGQITAEKETRKSYEIFIDKLWEMISPMPDKDKSTETILGEVKELIGKEDKLRDKIKDQLQKTKHHSQFFVDVAALIEYPFLDEKGLVLSLSEALKMKEEVQNETENIPITPPPSSSGKISLLDRIIRFIFGG